MADELGITPEEIAKRSSEIGGARNMEIRPMPNAIEILQTVSEMKVANYVYTHKGKSTKGVLENLAMEEFFEEVVTNQNGFARKPSPDAINYLLEKYQLCK